MAQIYEERKHVSYDKREKGDKIIALMQGKLLEGHSY